MNVMMPVVDIHGHGSGLGSASTASHLLLRDSAIAVWLDWLVTVHRPRRIAAVQERRIRRARANAMFSAGHKHSLALRADGSVACWGDNRFGKAPPAGVEGDFVAVAAGYYHSLAVRADGSVACWGANGIDFQAPTDASRLGELNGTRFMTEVRIL